MVGFQPFQCLFQALTQFLGVRPAQDHRAVPALPEHVPGLAATPVVAEQRMLPQYGAVFFRWRVLCRPEGRFLPAAVPGQARIRTRMQVPTTAPRRTT